MRAARLLLALVMPVVAGCAGPAPESSASPPASPAAEVRDDRPSLLERVNDAAVVQLYADDFAALPLREKTLIWHLYQAAIAGRDIFYDQKYIHNLAMRDTLEAVVTHPEVVDPDTYAEVLRYTKLFWLNTGPYNNLTARKFVLRLEPAAFADAVRAAAASGAGLPSRGEETVDDLLTRLEPMFFDPETDPSVTNKTPGDGRDILDASANNLYADVSLADLEGFEERYPLTSRLVDRGGTLTEEVYRIDGRYGPQIAEIVRHLEAAVPVATAPMADALRALIQAYRTGETADRRAYDIAWVADQASPVDTINYFTEVYLDARGIKGAWEALVFFVNQEKTEGIRALARDAQWFEDHMPWDPQYRKEGVQGITANAIDVVIETGDSGPLTPIGINLPNDSSVREQYGSKSVSLTNVVEAYDRALPEGFRTEFSWTPEEAARSERWGSLSSELVVNMHEVIGHASGRLAERLGGNAQAVLREHYSALEEARADLVGLYFLPDPKLVELGLVDEADQPDVVRAEYEDYARNALVQLRRVREGTQLEEDHMRNRQMIVHWLMANTAAIEGRDRDGKTYYVMVDADAFRDGVGRLLAEVQRIKSEGDYEAARTLFETYGIHFDPALRDEIVARVDALELPSYTGLVMPKLEAVRDADGQIADITISYPQDLMAQMLEYADLTRATRERGVRGGPGPATGP